MLNAPPQITVTEEGILTEVKLLPMKALPQITVTEEGILIEVI